MAGKSIENPKAMLAADLKEKWEEADRFLSKERRDYWLNTSFFFDEQWVYWHSSRREVIDYPRPRDSDRVRLTDNRIKPNLITLLAKLSKRELAFEVLPTAADDGTLKGARLSEAVLESARLDHNWESIRAEAMFDTFLGGTAAVSIDWNGQAGEELTRDEGTGKIVGTGEVEIAEHAICEFTLEPGSRSEREARWWMSAKAIPPEQARERYGLSKAPIADSNAGTSPLQRKLLEERGYPVDMQLCTVLCYYERPTPANKDGRVVTVIGDEVVVDTPWPFPFKHLNVVLFDQIEVPRRWVGDTILNTARPIQVAYNAARSNINEHMREAGIARMAWPDTMVDPQDPEDLTDQPGEILIYDGTIGAKPDYLQPPNLPRWLLEEEARLKASLDDIMFVHAISRGDVPSEDPSGLALSLLAEKDDTPLGLMAKNQSAGWGRWASMALELWAAKAIEPRSARVETDAGVPVILPWTGKALRGQTRATVPMDNVLPHSRIAVQAWLTNLADRFPQQFAGLAPEQLARMLDIPGTAFLGEMLDADAAKAETENHLMLMGRPVLPERFDDNGKHIAEHNRARKSPAYMYADADTRSIIDDHIKAHEMQEAEDVAAQQRMNAMQPGLGALPQGHEPPGSLVPADFAERQAQPAQPGMPPGA